MDTVEINRAKDQLEDLVRLAASGEDVRITDPRYGTIRLTPVRVPDVTAPRVSDTLPAFVPLSQPRELGKLKGKLQVPARLMEPMTETELRDWYGDGK